MTHGDRLIEFPQPISMCPFELKSSPLPSEEKKNIYKFKNYI
jgi:hypothetical protein